MLTLGGEFYWLGTMRQTMYDCKKQSMQRSTLKNLNALIIWTVLLYVEQF